MPPLYVLDVIGYLMLHVYLQMSPQISYGPDAESQVSLYQSGIWIHF